MILEQPGFCSFELLRDGSLEFKNPAINKKAEPNHVTCTKSPCATISRLDGLLVPRQPRQPGAKVQPFFCRAPTKHDWGKPKKSKREQSKKQRDRAIATTSGTSAKKLLIE